MNWIYRRGCCLCGQESGICSWAIRIKYEATYTYAVGLVLSPLLLPHFSSAYDESNQVQILSSLADLIYVRETCTKREKDEIKKPWLWLEHSNIRHQGKEDLYSSSRINEREKLGKRIEIGNSWVVGEKIHYQLAASEIYNIYLMQAFSPSPLGKQDAF